MDGALLGVGVGSLSDELSVLHLVSGHYEEEEGEEQEKESVDERGSPGPGQQQANQEDLREPEMTICSLRTTAIFLPARSCLATIEARRPIR